MLMVAAALGSAGGLKVGDNVLTWAPAESQGLKASPRQYTLCNVLGLHILSMDDFDLLLESMGGPNYG